MVWNGEDYQQRFDQLAASGVEVHGEAGLVADLVTALAMPHVLDAGCGTGRVSIELARRGIDVVGVDADASMIATAARLAPDLTWIEADLATPGLDLGRRFDLVVMAGNVPLFTPPGTEGALVAGCAHHLLAGATLVAGFQLDDRYSLERYDQHCADTGLDLVERWSTWAKDPFPGDGSYAVSQHRSPPAS
jgi:SAM-dependent methyltransferase